MTMMDTIPGAASTGRRRFLRQTLFGAAALFVAPALHSRTIFVQIAPETARQLLFFSKEEYLKQGVAAAARIHFAAGAKEVMTLHARPTVIRSEGEIDKKIRSASWEKNEIALFSAHPLGTCRMGIDPRTSVVDPHCQTHDVRGLFVIDGSVTPTSLGVNPQITLLAIAEKSAEWVAENFAGLAR